MSSSNASYTLRYFDSIGLAESSRILLTATGVEWTEDHPEWPQEKPNQPHGRLPVLVEKSTDGSPDFVICESANIERYIARAYGFLPADLKQAALQEQIRDLISDVVSLFFAQVQCKNKDDKAEFQTKFEGLLETLIKVQTKLLKNNGNTGRMFGDKLSYADIITYGFYIKLVVGFVKFNADIADNVKSKLTPEIVKLISVVESDPLVAKYKSRGGSLPYGRMPVLIEKAVDSEADFIICESGSIERYLARKYGFIPADLKQAALQEQLRDLMFDVNHALAGRLSSKCKEDRVESKNKFEDLLALVIKEQTKLITSNDNNGYLFGDCLSYADIISYGFYKNLLQSVVVLLPDVADIVRTMLTPEVVNLISAVESDPKVVNHTSKGSSLARVAVME
ncbi:hypothetical protein GGH96_001438 [Coemansia sp. RSA 1972]|nr:hypothetical protein GGH96_001438 [Coemansia sp. RSA 1972]